MSYDPLRQRAQNARDELQSHIRKAKDAKRKAEIELDLLWNLEAMLNLDAILDAIPEPEQGEAA